MLQDDRTRPSFLEGEFTPFLVLCLATTILSVAGFLRLLYIFSTHTETTTDSGVFWILGSVLFLWALATIMAIWKYFRSTASVNDKERGLRRDIQLLEGFFDTNPSIMWVKNMEGDYSLVNQGFREFTGSKDMPLEHIDISKIFMSANATLMADQEQHFRI
tara:strand:+ start:376 stop:858 length:483 start_codon:yes stop_codon:yes gene_type:complete